MSISRKYTISVFYIELFIPLIYNNPRQVKLGQKKLHKITDWFLCNSYSLLYLITSTSINLGYRGNQTSWGADFVRDTHEGHSWGSFVRGCFEGYSWGFTSRLTLINFGKPSKTLETLLMSDIYRVTIIQFYGSKKRLSQSMRK